MHTVELLLDPELEQGVRDLWRRLHEAGLPSLATHRHPTNRPHLTLEKRESLAGVVLPALPIPVELGPARMLGRTLIRGVRGVRLEGLTVPHVSLALRVPEDEQPAALTLLADLPPARGHLVAARSYDTLTRTVIGL